MKIVLAVISPHRGGPSGPASELIRLYVERASHYCSCTYVAYTSEARFLESVAAAGARTRPVLLLADGAGKQLTSKQIAALLGGFQDNGVQQLIVGIGPADGWSAASLARADARIGFGIITLPHELAAVVAAEQIYRALTIRAGHPYHCGH